MGVSSLVEVGDGLCVGGGRWGWSIVVERSKGVYVSAPNEERREVVGD